MEFPYTLHIGNFPILLHGIFEFLGIFIAFRYYVYLKKKHGDTISSSNRLYIVVGAALGAVLGSRIIGASENIHAWMMATNKLAYFNGNKTLVGGLIGGLAGVEIVKTIISEHQKSGDLFTFPLLLGMIIGRVGCFSAGIYEETYGIQSSLPWAMNLGDGIYRHPVTLYEILFLLMLWTILWWVSKKYLLQEGALFKLMMIAYLAFRLVLDLIKPHVAYIFGLGTIQLTCIAGLLYYYRYFFSPSLFLEKRKLYAR